MRGKWTRLVVEEIRRIREVRQRGWIKDVEEAAGRTVGYLSRVINGEVPRLDVELLFCLFDRCILDPRELLREVGFDVAFNPHTYLERIRHQGVSDPEIEALERAVESLSDVAIDIPCPELLQELAVIDTLRFSDVREAASRTSAVIPQIAASGSPSLMIQTLGVLGSVRRVQGNMGQAARAYRLAFENAAPFSSDRARLLERLAYLLANQGWLHAAEDSAAASVEGFTLLHDQVNTGRALITRGVMLRRMGTMRRPGCSISVAYPICRSKNGFTVSPRIRVWRVANGSLVGSIKRSSTLPSRERPTGPKQVLTGSRFGGCRASSR